MPSGMSLLNFIRNKAGLKGTKSGCKEGDCGACTVLKGILKDNKTVYKSIVSCLTPLGNVHGTHIVTIEGLDNDVLTPVQNEMINHAGTQCGFCTPGFIISLTGYALGKSAGLQPEAIASVAGNICRCTGYKSIGKAATKVAELLEDKDAMHDIEWLTEHQFVPGYFSTIPDRLAKIKERNFVSSQPDLIVAGGTDLMVQKPNAVKVSALNLTANHRMLSQIKQKENRLQLGGSVTVAELLESETMLKHFPRLPQWFKLVSSEQIRNMATLAGNFVNASPIGDMTVFFLALDSNVTLENNAGKQRTIKLHDFFIDYKKLDLQEGELIHHIEFGLPGSDTKFNFEKVSKRMHLDIASVNTAINLSMDGNMINNAVLSAGGIGPVPAFLRQTSNYLSGKALTMETLILAEKVIQDEITPISDIRGSVAYKRLLLRQLFFAHFTEIFPEQITPQTVVPAIKQQPLINCFAQQK